MILIGTRDLTRTVRRGQFHCPGCESQQDYVLRSRRPFLTLYFIPTVPIADAESIVRCAACNQNWDPLALEAAAERMSRENEFSEQAFRLAILVVLADDVISPQEIEGLQRVGLRLLGRKIDREELGQLCSSAQSNRIPAKNYALTIREYWNQDQKMRALQAMFLAASAGGNLPDEQSELLASMQHIFQLSQSEYESTIEAALSE